MSLHPDREELMTWRDGEVAVERGAEIASHVDACVQCRDFVDSLRTVSAQLGRWTVDPAPASLKPASRQSSTRGGRRQAVLWAAAAVFVIGVLATVRVDCAPVPGCDLRTAHFAFMPQQTHPVVHEPLHAASAAEQQTFERDWLARRRLPITAAPGAKVTVVMFIDWQCPACKMAERAYAAVFADFEKRMPGAVAVQFRDYPLNTRCNPNVPVEMHSAACEAAVAVRLSREHGTATALINWLFDHQETLTPDAVRGAAQTVGKISDFAARYAAVLKDVARDVAEGRSLEVGGTPTCFINGVLARSNGGRSLFTPEEIRLAIEVELKR